MRRPCATTEHSYAQGQPRTARAVGDRSAARPLGLTPMSLRRGKDSVISHDLGRTHTVARAYFPPSRSGKGALQGEFGKTRQNSRYLTIMAQAMRSLALPAGSDFMSSGLACITSAVPPLENSE